MDEPDLLSAEHLYLLLAAAIGPVMLRWLQNFLEPVTMAATAGLRPAMDKEALAPRNTVGWDEICNFHAAPLTWSKARRDLKYEEGMALGVGLIRLLLWHLLQPAVYFYLIHVYRRQLSNAIFGLAVVVGVREGLYMVFTLIALVVNPAFLLINLNTDDDFHKRVAWKATYVFAPEFYVFQALANLCASGYFPMVFCFKVAADICGLVALCIGLSHPPFPDPLAVCFALSIAGGLVKPLALCHAYG
jgi:hypothetical protein